MPQIQYGLQDIAFEWDNQKSNYQFSQTQGHVRIGRWSILWSVLFPLVWWQKQKEKYMKTNKIVQRLQKDRPMTMVSIRIPDDVIEDLKRIAPALGFSGYQALIKAYIGRGLRADLERIERRTEVSALIKSLRKKGVKEEIISSALAEAQNPK